MAPVAQRADDLGGERFVQQLHHRIEVRVIAGHHRALGDVLPGAAAQLLYIRQEGLGLGPGPSAWYRTHFVTPVEAERAGRSSLRSANCFLMSALALS